MELTVPYQEMDFIDDSYYCQLSYRNPFNQECFFFLVQKMQTKPKSFSTT